jgi:spermidine dehydrogenase
VTEGCWTAKALGMDLPIARRDFLNGIAMAIGSIGTKASAAQLAESWPQDQPDYYPPVLTGLRGSHPGSFENAHALRDGDVRGNRLGSQDTGESYNLVVVGGGISGLAAAHFYRAAKPAAKVLILDNHDDFGGHAKRNEFRLGGKLHLLNGGTLEIDSPRPYSRVADGLLQALGVDPVALTKACSRDRFYPSLGLTRAVFFDEETFGQDRLSRAGSVVTICPPRHRTDRNRPSRLHAGSYVRGEEGPAIQGELSRLSARHRQGRPGGDPGLPDRHSG